MIAKMTKPVALADELKDKKSHVRLWAIVHGNSPNDRGVIEARLAAVKRPQEAVL